LCYNEVKRLQESTVNTRPNYLTLEGKKKLEEELEYLTTTARKELAERLTFAIKQGRIKTIEAMLRNLVIVEEVRAETVASDTVNIGCQVTVVEEEYGDPETYMIVGAAEANPKQGKISNESPIGKAVLGKRVGDKVMVNAPAGVIEFKIVKIE
jgi:transcription elongation factor GreA